MKYKTLFFDFDGVLADSVEVKTRAFAELFKPYGRKILEKVVDHHRANGGMTRKNKFIHYYEEFLDRSLDEDGLNSLCRKFSSLVVDQVVASDEIPGALNFVKRWYRSIPCFIVSATPDDEIIEIVKQRNLSGYFREVLGSGRTKTENLAYLIEKYNIVPEASIFYGDAASDYQAAKDCDVNFFGILPGPDAPLLKIAPDIEWALNFTSEVFL